MSDLETCVRCGKDIDGETPVFDMFEEPHHAECYENAQIAQAEAAFERSLSGDDGTPSLMDTVRAAQQQRAEHDSAHHAAARRFVASAKERRGEQ